MQPVTFQFVTDGTTFINPIGLGFTILMGVLLLALPRRHALLPIIVLICYMTMGMRLMVFSLNFTMLRVLLVFGWARIILRGELTRIKLNGIDKVVAYSAISGLTALAVLWQSYDAIKYKVGGLYSSVGFYFLFRYLVRNSEDVIRYFKMLALFITPLAGMMLLERFTGRNGFAAFGGVPEFTFVRLGELRCQGPFAHPILAGTMGATVAPFFIALWWSKKARVLALMGIVSAIVIVVTSASSGPFFAFFAALLAMCLWPARKWMRRIRWGVLAMIVCLQLVMKAPVWFVLGNISIIGGSTGYHRAYLIDRAIANLPDWWLLGTKSTAAWASKDAHLFDVTNAYVAQGADGGLLTMILFILVIALCFRGVGLSLRRPENASQQTYPYLWALGGALFAHSVSFISVCYFDQNLIIYQLLIATIASVAGPYLVAKQATKVRGVALSKGARSAAADEDRAASWGPGNSLTEGSAD